MADFDFGSFLNNASGLGLKYLDNTYINPDANSSKKEEQAKKYEQIQQRATPTPVRSPLDNKLIVYGAFGVVGLLTLAIVLKGK